MRRIPRRALLAGLPLPGLLARPRVLRASGAYPERPVSLIAAAVWTSLWVSTPPRIVPSPGPSLVAIAVLRSRIARTGRVRRTGQ